MRQQSSKKSSEFLGHFGGGLTWGCSSSGLSGYVIYIYILHLYLYTHTHIYIYTSYVYYHITIVTGC